MPGQKSYQKLSQKSKVSFIFIQKSVYYGINFK